MSHGHRASKETFHGKQEQQNLCHVSHILLPVQHDEALPQVGAGKNTGLPPRPAPAEARISQGMRNPHPSSLHDAKANSRQQWLRRLGLLSPTSPHT